MTVTTVAPYAAPSPVARLRARGRVRGAVPLLGPAFVAAIAYVDPGNFATNFAAGASYGYLLVWVVVGANLVAMLIQALSAKVGLATGENLPQLSRRHFPRWVTRGLWGQAELVVVATDLAEVIGGAVALNLLFHLPLVEGGLVTGVVAYALVALRARGYRPFEVVVIGLFAVIAVGFLLTLVRAHPSPAAVVGGVLPRFDGAQSLVLAAGILGATVMPHAVYLHSALHQDRVPAHDLAERRHLLRHQRIDIVAALGIAGLVNGAMLVTAAALFGAAGGPGSGAGGGSTTLEGVHASLATALDSPAALVFAVTLLASGFASAGVGTCAGEVVMAGYLRRRVRPVVRRVVTLAPTLAVLSVGVDPTRALVLSQVVLSFGIPFALVPLIVLTRRVDLMGELVNRRSTTVAASTCAALVISLNGFLVARSLGWG
jgi:manganese transport protein